MYDQPLFDKNLSMSFHVMVGWIIWLRVRMNVATDQAAGEASEDFLVFVVLRNDLEAIAFHPSFDRPGVGLFVFFASTPSLSLIT